LTEARAVASTVEAVAWGADAASLAGPLGEYGATTLYDVGDLGGTLPGVPVAAAAAADTWVTSARLVAASCPWAMVIWMNGMAALPSIGCGVGGR